MTKRTIEMTTEQMQRILDGAPSGAEYYMRFGALYYKIDSRVFATSNGDWFASNFKSLKHLLTKNPLKLSDIRAELSTRLSNSAKNDTQSDLSVEQEQSVIEPTYTKCALLRDYSLEKLQWLINENLANGWNLVGAVVSAGIHNDTFVATMMKVAGDE